MDYVVSHYSDNELLELLEVDHPTHTSIASATIDKQQRHSDDRDLQRFFADAATQLYKTYPANSRVATRLITIDSAYRENPLADPDQFTFYLSEPLHHVTSISLYSVELPKTWYNFSAAKGNTTAVLQTLDSADNVLTFPVTIPDGDYSAPDLVEAFTLALNATTPFTGTFNPVNHQATFAATPPRTVKLTFYDPSLPQLSLSRANKNIGWALGFRVPSVVFNSNSPPVTTPSPVTVHSTKYVQMRLDDFSPARFNNANIHIGRVDKRSSTPPASETLFRKANGRLGVQAVAPRRLTSNQLYSLNATSKPTPLLAYDDPDANIFAKIPLKNVDNDFGKIIVEFSGPLQQNTREYFNSVLLTTMAVSLYDDKNNALSLNGCDWSFSLIVKQLV